ncbi:transcription initiation factor TFIID subunit 11 [Eurosta solidaginis]|uniref:transcription initiation factor TFIID subunit 11 n=1 Tax=Eurosta solidaginis TaxID=178769 RepID=UPI0035306E66
MSNISDDNNNSTSQINNGENINNDLKKFMKNAPQKLISDNSTTGDKNAGETGNRKERCVLCLDEKRLPVVITCGHSFCYDCLDVYKSYQRYAWANRCPICRGSLKEKRRSVKRKHPDMESGATSHSATTASSSNYTAARMRLNPTSATIAAATAAVATVTATALSETAAEAAVEQNSWLEEFMAIVGESNIFGTSSSSATTPTNSVSTVSASEYASVYDEEEPQDATQEAVEVYEHNDYASEMGEEEDLEEDEEVFGEDVDLDDDENEDFEDDEDDGDDDEDSNDLDFFLDDENDDYQENDDYTTVDEDDIGDDDDDGGSYEELTNDTIPDEVEHYNDDSGGAEDILLVDEVIIVD